MDFEPKHYYRAAQERLEQARELYRRDERAGRRVNLHPISLYVAGVGVEGMLRAYITRKTKTREGGGQRSQRIESRHNISRLYEESEMWRVKAEIARIRRLTEGDIDQIKRELDAAVNRVVRLWRNNYRYASEERLRSFLFEIGEHKGIKGDILKENLRRLIESAATIIDKGTLLWSDIQTSPRN
jgi:hypothetical protein